MQDLVLESWSKIKNTPTYIIRLTPLSVFLISDLLQPINMSFIKVKFIVAQHFHSTPRLCA